MKKLIAAAFIASAGLALISSAQAMPVAPLDQAEVGAVVQVFCSPKKFQVDDFVCRSMRRRDSQDGSRT